MLDELLLGGALLGVLLGDVHTWDDETGKRFENELEGLLRTESDNVQDIVGFPMENGMRLHDEIERLTRQMRESISQTNDMVSRIHDEIQRTSI